jgi:hypothetical protein
VWPEEGWQGMGKGREKREERRHLGKVASEAI